MNWLITLYNRFNSTEAKLKVGDRILTKKGMGTVRGGCIHIELDNPIRHDVHPNQRRWTFDISKEI